MTKILSTIFRTMPKVPDAEDNLIPKTGFVTKKRKDCITVNVEGEIVTFFLNDVTMTEPFDIRPFDRIKLYCKYASFDGEVELVVRKIDPPSKRQTEGTVTEVDNDCEMDATDYGIVDGNIIFYGDAVSSDYTNVRLGDRVTMDCIECQIVDENLFKWRCVYIALAKLKSETPQYSFYDKKTANKNGIEITENVRFEFQDVNDEKKELTMLVANTSSNDFEVLESYFVGIKNESQLTLVSPARTARFPLKRGETRKYKFEARPKFIGRGEEQFVIRFRGNATKDFEITRFIEVSVDDPQHLHNTIGTGPNARRNFAYTREILMNNQSTVISPRSTRPNFVARRFDDYHIPDILKEIVFAKATSRSSIFDALKIYYPHLHENLTIENYSQTFHDLLHLEECAIQHNFRTYDKRSFFDRQEAFLVLTMDKNLAESRPSIVIGEYSESFW